MHNAFLCLCFILPLKNVQTDSELNCTETETFVYNNLEFTHYNTILSAIVFKWRKVGNFLDWKHFKRFLVQEIFFFFHLSSSFLQNRTRNKFSHYYEIKEKMLNCPKIWHLQGLLGVGFC